MLAIPASAFADRFDLKLVELMMESIAFYFFVETKSETSTYVGIRISEYY